MAESEIGILSCNGDTMAALYIAAECQSANDSDIEALREAFKAAAEVELQSNEDLTRLIDMTTKMLQEANSTDTIVLSENVKIFEKLDQFITSENVENASETLAQVLNYGSLINGNIGEAQTESKDQEATVFGETSQSDTLLEMKEYFVESFNNIIERLLLKMVDNKTITPFEISLPGAYLGLIPISMSALAFQNLSLFSNKIQLPTFCFKNASVCNNKEDLAYAKIAAFNPNLYDFVNPSIILNGGSTNISILSAANGSNGYVDTEINHMEDPIIISFPTHSSPENATLLTPEVQEDQLMVYHEAMVHQIQSNLVIVIKKTKPNCSLVLYFQQNKLPWPTDFQERIEFPMGREKLVWTVNVSTTSTERYVLGVAETTYLESGVHLGGYNFTKNFTCDYSISFHSASCVFMEFNSSIQELGWSSRGCQISEESTESQIVCKCYHMSTFGAGIFVAPNTIDFDYVFSNMSVAQNPSIYSTLLAFILLYTLTMVWGFWKDRKSRKAADFNPLPDNSISDSYLYKISVKTGGVRGASTDSVVKFLLCGKNGDTDVRSFPSSKKMFRRGQTDNFLMSSRISLGDLDCCRIWHDNTGRGIFRNWFLESITVYDTNEERFFHFLCNQWLSINDYPYKTGQTLPLFDMETVDNLGVAFKQNFSKTVLNEHLWFSVIATPKKSVFTRCQRITCCFCVILTSMLASAMWYGRKSEAPEKEGFEIGPFSASWSEIFIGFATSLIILPINILLVQIFKKSKRKGCDSATKERMLPWWCVYIGWLLAVVTIIVSICFILFYAIMMGDSETRKWLSSIFFSIFSSIFFTQPLKVILLVIILSVICRKIDADTEEAQMKSKTASYGEVKNSDEVIEVDDVKPSLVTSRGPTINENLEQREGNKDAKIYSLSSEMVVSISLIAATFLLIHGNRDLNGFLLQSHVTRQLTNQPREIDHRVINLPNLEIATEAEFWNWAVNVLVPVLGGESSLKKGLMKDHVNRVVGYSLMRQTRVKKGTCTVREEFRHLFHDCIDFISVLNTERGSYGPRWTNKVSRLRPAYHYFTQIAAVPKSGLFGIYGGGGYKLLLRKWITKTRKQLRNLQKEKWIDYQTRAIIIEFSIYSVQVNLFCIGHVLVETPPTGGYVPSVHFRIVQLFKHSNIMQIFREVFYVLNVLLLIWVVVNNFIKIGWRHLFKTWNNLLDFVAVGLSLIVFVIYFLRWQETERVVEILNETKGKAYVGMAYAAVLEELYNYLLGLVGVVVTIKFARLLRFNRRISFITDILVNAGTGVMAFCVLALIVMSAFAFLFYLLLGREVKEFNTVFTCLGKCFGFILYRNHFFKPILAVKPTLGFIAVSGYFFAVVLLIDNIFITTLNAMIDVVRDDAQKQTNDYEIVAYAKYKVLSYFLSTYNGTMQSDMSKVEDDTENHLNLLESKADDFEQYINHYIGEQKKDGSNRLRGKVICSN